MKIRNWLVVMAFFVFGCDLALAQTGFGFQEGIGVRVRRNGTAIEFVDPNYNGDSTPIILLKIDTTATPISFGAPVSAPQLSVATALTGLSNSTTAGMYSGSTVSQTFGLGYIEVGTTLRYTQNTAFVITHSAPFTTVPALHLDITKTTANSTTQYFWYAQTPTTAVCTVLFWKQVVDGGNNVTYSEPTTGEISIRWSAIGK